MWNTWISFITFTPSLLKKLAGFKRTREAFANFLRALAFLSVLAPPCDASGENFAKSLAQFGPAGFLLGAISSAAAWAVCLVLEDFSQTPTIFAALFGGCVWLCLEIFLSRALHWDGVADLGDGLGSGASGERFWRILKDSRVGTFGVLAVFPLLMADAILAGAHLCAAFATSAFGQLILLSLAPAWGRLAPIWMGARLGPWLESGLGRMVCENISLATRRKTTLCAAAILAVAFMAGTSFASLACLSGAEAALILGLNKIAAARGGLSGDFFGAGIETSQTLFIFFSLF